MFETKKVPGPQDITQDQLASLDPNRLTIHTMKKDLANPPATAVSTPKNTPPKITAIPTNETAVFPQKMATTSPFLTSEEKRAPTPSNIAPKPGKSGPAPKTITLKQAPKKSSGGKKIALAVVIILIVFLLGGGGYYFWAQRKNPIGALQTLPAAQNPKPPVKAPIIPNIAPDKPNYLSLDLNSSNGAILKNILNDYAAKVTQSKATVPVAFIVTDSQNNPITFQTFAEKFGLSLPQNLLAQLGPGFTLYMYNDSGNTRIGLAVAEKNDAQLKAALFQAESSLLQAMEPLFLTSSYTLNNRPFENSSYNGAAIRFNNIISPIELSVDYTVYQNQWLVGTTKMTLRSIIDLLNSQNGTANSQ